MGKTKPYEIPKQTVLEAYHRRFIQADSVLDGLNRYTYCQNNPIIYTDPTGMITGAEETVTLIIVGAAATWGLGMMTSPSFRTANASFAEYMASSIDNAKQKAAEVQKESEQNRAAFKIVGINAIIKALSGKKDEANVEGSEDIISDKMGFPPEETRGRNYIPPASRKHGESEPPPTIQPNGSNQTPKGEKAIKAAIAALLAKLVTKCKSFHDEWDSDDPENQQEGSGDITIENGEDEDGQ